MTVLVNFVVWFCCYFSYNSYLHSKERDDTLSSSVYLIVMNQKLIAQLLSIKIHLREVEVLVLARDYSVKKQTVVVIIDDLAAREIVTSLGVVTVLVTGTVGILLEQSKNGFSLLQAKLVFFLISWFVKTTFRLSTKVYSRLLKWLEDFSK